MAQYIWEGHTIDVRFRLLPNWLWIGCGFFVCVDGDKQFRPPGKLEFRGTTTHFEILHHGRVVPGMVQSVGWVLAKGTSYNLLVDNITLDKGHLRAENWRFPFWVAMGFVLCELAVVCYLMFVRIRR